MTAPTIWCDLDETIVASASHPSPGSALLVTERWAILRPGARECLATLRRLAHVRLITYAPLTYATAACDVFSLGFAGSDIIAQEIWTSFLREQPSLGRLHDVLVEDDQSRTTSAKCRFIGIASSRVVVVPAYKGGPDDALTSVPARVAQLLGRDKGFATPEEGSAFLLTAEGGCVSLVDGCRLIRKPEPVLPNVLREQILEGKIIACRRDEGEYMVPVWQFLPEGGVLPGLDEVLEAIKKIPGSGSLSPFTFFLQSDPLTGGRPPLEALRAGKVDQVLNAVDARAG